MNRRFSIERSPILTVLTATLFVIAGARLAQAKDKKEPVPQWGLDAAKIQTPDYARDAPSVILFDEYLETVDEQGRATEREREAIRILQPQGRNERCAIPYDVDEKINYFREWTIGADEKQYQAAETDFVEKGDPEIPIMLSTEKVRVVHPPAADVGATILCESEELLASWKQEKDWFIQSSIPVVSEALEVDLPAGRDHAESWHRYEPVKPSQVAPNHWRWEIKDMQRIDLRDVKASPDEAALAARMSVSWGDTAVQGRDNQWRALGMWITNLEAHRSDPSPEISAKAQELVAGAPDFFTRLTRISEYVQNNIRYFVVERGIGGYQAHPAADIFRNRFGDCKDKSTLVISMLQAIGIQAYYLAVDDRRGVVDPDAPSPYGDHMITAIEIPADVKDPRLQAIAMTKEGKRYLVFDPTNERTPIGNLPSYLQGSYGILASGPSSQVIALPVLDPQENGTDRKGTFALSADGSLTGSVDTAHNGPEGGDYRLFLKYSDEKERREFWETRLARDLPGLTLDSIKFEQPPSLQKPLEFHYNVTVPQYAHRAGPLLLVRPRVVGDVSMPFDDKPRSVPIDLAATGRWHDSFDISIPAGYVVDETPDPVNLDLDFASYKSSVSVKGNTLHYERDYVVRQVEIPPAKAADFRKLETVIVEDERGTAVLKKQ